MEAPLPAPDSFIFDDTCGLDVVAPPSFEVHHSDDAIEGMLAVFDYGTSVTIAQLLLALDEEAGDITPRTPREVLTKRLSSKVRAGTVRKIEAVWLTPFVAKGLVLPSTAGTDEDLRGCIIRPQGIALVKAFERIAKRDGLALETQAGVHVFPKKATRSELDGRQRAFREAFTEVGMSLRPARLAYAASRGRTHGRMRWIPTPAAVIKVAQDAVEAQYAELEQTAASPDMQEEGAPWCCPMGHAAQIRSSPTAGRPYATMGVRYLQDAASPFPRVRGLIGEVAGRPRTDPSVTRVKDEERGTFRNLPILPHPTKPGAWTRGVPPEAVLTMGMLGERWMEAWFAAHIAAGHHDEDLLLDHAPDLAFHLALVGRSHGQAEFAEATFVWRTRTPPVEDAGVLREVARSVVREISGDARGMLTAPRNRPATHKVVVGERREHGRTEPLTTLDVQYGPQSDLSLPLPSAALGDLARARHAIGGSHAGDCTAWKPGSVPVIYGVLMAGGDLAPQDHPLHAQPRAGELRLADLGGTAFWTVVAPLGRESIVTQRVRVWWST